MVEAEEETLSTIWAVIEPLFSHSCSRRVVVASKKVERRPSRGRQRWAGSQPASSPSRFFVDPRQSKKDGVGEDVEMEVDQAGFVVHLSNLGKAKLEKPGARLLEHRPLPSS